MVHFLKIVPREYIPDAGFLKIVPREYIPDAGFLKIVPREYIPDAGFLKIVLSFSLIKMNSLRFKKGFIKEIIDILK